MMTAKLFIVPFWLNTTVFLAANGFALWKGGAAERIYALYMVLGSIGLGMVSGGAWGDQPTHEILIGAGGLLLTVSLSLNTDRRWPLAAASLQLVGLATTVGQQLMHFSPWAYGTAQITWDYASNLVIALGTYRAMLARSGRLVPGSLG